MSDAPLFEWDEAKSSRNHAERGFDFDYACRIFAGPVIEEEDRRFDYRERRIVATGKVGTETFVVVYTWRGRPPPDYFRATCEEERTWCLQSDVP
jgi:uncharacterized protein